MSKYFSPKSADIATITSPRLKSKASSFTAARTVPVSPNKQMIVSNECATGFDGFFLVHYYNSIRLDQVSELWSHACANARDMSFSRRASESDRTFGSTATILILGLFKKYLRDSDEGTGGACPDKNPIDFIEFARDLMRRLLGMSILVGNVSVLIQPYGVTVRL